VLQAAAERAAKKAAEAKARETAVAESKALAGTVRIPGGAAKRELSPAATKELSQIGRAGVRQREAQAIKEQTIARSGERGWQTAREHFQARMQEGGEFPLRLPQRSTASGPEVGFMGRDVYGTPQTVEAGERMKSLAVAEGRVTDFPVGTATRRVGREQIAARRAIGGTTVRESPLASRTGRTDVETQAGYTGRPRGIRSIETGVSEQTMETARRGILSGAIKAIPVVGGGMLSSRAFGKGKDRS
jgi:hypothetical protein